MPTRKIRPSKAMDDLIAGRITEDQYFKESMRFVKWDLAMDLRRQLKKLEREEKS